MFIWAYLLRPLDYLRIHHEVKLRFDLWLPVGITAPLVLIYLLLPVRVPILAPSGLVDGVNSLFQVLVGFYITALAAVATFAKPDMDEPMAGQPPTLEVRLASGERVPSPLSRRRFLSFLFGYLSFASLSLYFAGLAGKLLVGNIGLLSVMWGYRAFVAACLFGYLFCLAHIIVTTLLGLYYLTDRIHREPAKVLPSKVDDNP